MIAISNCAYFGVSRLCNVEFAYILSFSEPRLNGAKPREHARGHAVSTLQSLPNSVVFSRRRSLVRIIRESIPGWRELVSRESNEIDTSSVKLGPV